MPGIRRVKWWNTKVGYQIPKEHDIDYDSDHSRYCQSCFQVAVKSELKRRLYRVEDSKLVAETAPAPDADRFRQCYRCGDIVPIYNVKQESALVDFVEPTKNPFDENADSIESLERTSILKKKSKYARKRAQIDSINDPDLEAELASGNALVDYFEH
jgi:hypothetical protein